MGQGRIFAVSAVFTVVDAEFVLNIMYALPAPLAIAKRER